MSPSLVMLNATKLLSKVAPTYPPNGYAFLHVLGTQH